jgi:hypothetical protein
VIFLPWTTAHLQGSVETDLAVTLLNERIIANALTEPSFCREVGFCESIAETPGSRASLKLNQRLPIGQKAALAD